MSTSSPDSVPRAAHSRRIRICRIGWKVFRFLGGLILLALVLPKVVELLLY